MHLPKPVMRGLLLRRLRIHLALAFLTSFAGAAWYKYGVAEPRKLAYAEFYKNYDSEKEINAMIEAGVLESARPIKE